MVKSASGRQRRMFFSAPAERCAEMVADIRAQLELRGEQGDDLQSLCQVAEEVAANHQGAAVGR